MTPKEKAEELVELFKPFSSMEGTTEDGLIYNDAVQLWNAKQCALIAMDEMEKVERNALLKFNLINEDMVMHYWQLVKQEIEKL